MARRQQDRIEMSWWLDEKPRAVFDAWLDSDAHGAMTGGPADVDPRVGGRFSAWGGYIEGKTTVIDRRQRRIRQTWRTLDFRPGDLDSLLEVRFVARSGKTQLTLVHTRLQPGDGAKYTLGWLDHYLRPMQAHFGA